MQREVLFDYMTGVSLETGIIVGLYSFNEFSGVYTFNEKFDNPKSLVSDGKINSEEHHLYALGSGKYLNNISGSGDFTRNSLFKLGDNIETSGWTTFLNFDHKDFENELSLGKVLFSTMENSESESGFHVGINGSNRLYFEYKDIDSKKQIFTLNKELSERNLISVSKSENSLEVDLTYYDISNSRTYSKAFSVQGALKENGDNILNSNEWYLGDFHTPSVGYTGFSGYVGDFLLLNTNLTKQNLDDFSNLFFATGYEFSELKFDIISGAEVTGTAEVTGVTGSGITGYEMVCTSTVYSRDGSAINICVNSGVSGALTGYHMVYFTGSGANSYQSGYITDDRILVESGQFYNYNKEAIVFEDQLDQSDAYEVYYYDGYKSNLNIKPPVNGAGSFINLGNDFNNENINVYQNGVYVRSGNNLVTGIEDGNYYVSNQKAYLTGDLISSNEYVYDKIDKPILRSGYDENTALFKTHHEGGSELVTENGPPLEVLVANVNNSDDYDVYLNGQKMLSGWGGSHLDGLSGKWGTRIEYPSLFDGENIYILKRGFMGLSTGDITFVPREEGLRLEQGTGSLLNLSNSNKMFSEQVWRNGVRQVENLNYYKINKNSLLNTGIRIEKQTSLMYNNNDLFFNI